MNKWYCVLFICLVQPTIYTHGFGLLSKSKLVIDVYDYKTCPEEKDLPIQIVDVDTAKDPETNIMFVSGTLVSKVTIDEKLKGHVTILRCSTKADESCLKYVSYEFDNLCYYLWKENNPSYEFTKRTQGLGTKCPINPGSYPIEEVPLDFNGMFPTGGVTDGHWRVRFRASVEGKVAMCMLTSAELKMKRSRT